MLIDTHAHLNFKAFKKDADEIIQQCLAKNTWIINIGSCYATSQRAVEIAQGYNEGIYAAIGLHPIHTIDTPFNNEELQGNSSINPEKFSQDKYLALTKQNKVVAIGEIGLDYVYAKNPHDKKIQANVFKEQLKLAQQTNLPVVVHCRNAWQDTIEILKELKTQKLHGVAHFFSGNLQNAKTLFNLGFLVSFTGVITFTNDYDRLIEKLPLEKIMIETDSPYATPNPHRGKRNSPLYIGYIAQKIATIKKIPYEKVARVTTSNAQQLFGIP